MCAPCGPRLLQGSRSFLVVPLPQRQSVERSRQNPAGLLCLGDGTTFKKSTPVQVSTSSKATVLEPNASLHKKLRHALTKAGLKVTSATDVEALTSQSLVFVGPSVTRPSPLSQNLLESHPAAFVVALKKQGFRAPHADAVLTLKVSVPDVKARLFELAMFPVQPPTTPEQWATMLRSDIQAWGELVRNAGITPN